MQNVLMVILFLKKLIKICFDLYEAYTSVIDIDHWYSY